MKCAWRQIKFPVGGFNCCVFAWAKRATSLVSGWGCVGVWGCWVQGAGFTDDVHGCLRMMFTDDVHGCLRMMFTDDVQGCSRMMFTDVHG